MDDKGIIKIDLRVFAERAREAREAAGMSTCGVARVIGGSQDTIRRMEAGECEPRIGTAARIARAYGVSVDWLCGLEDDANGNGAGAEAERERKLYLRYLTLYIERFAAYRERLTAFERLINRMCNAGKRQEDIYDKEECVTVYEMTEGLMRLREIASQTKDAECVSVTLTEAEVGTDDIADNNR